MTTKRAAVSDIRAELVSASAQSYPDMFRRRVADTPRKVAYHYPALSEPEQWLALTWDEARTKVDALAGALFDLGITKGERVALASSTRIEWVLIDLAIACCGAVTTTIYPSTKPDDEEFILTDSGAVFLVAENTAQLVKVLHRPALDAQLRRIILIDDDRQAGECDDPRVIRYRDLESRGVAFNNAHPGQIDESIAGITRDDISTIIYTSGTTGTPKGARISHGSWTYEGVSVAAYDIIYDTDMLYIWLPLAHVFGRDLLSAQIAVGTESAIDGRVNRIVQGVGEVQPTVMVGVPRIYEKIRAAVITMYPKRGIKGRISRWAFAVGRDSRRFRLEGNKMPGLLGLKYRIADALVYSKLKAKLGGRMRFMVSGSAKLSPQVQEWFYSAGITLVEGYGLTETSAIAAVDHPERPHFGTVGQMLPGVDVRIAEDGEVLINGPIVAHSYHNLPELSAEAFQDGWFHTGDIGELDDAGYLRITDRKKDLLKTSNGKYIAPQKVENAIMANTPYAAQAIVIGEGHQYAAALIILDRDSLNTWAKRHGRTNLSYAELTQLPEIHTSIDRCIRRANRRLERWENIRKYLILDRELLLELDEVTPALKVRRNQVLAHFAAAIDDIYAEENSSVPFLPEKKG
ncbi:MAG: long-chain fatty acid--CoA ligase [Propionibacteriaceae bacterium]|jgi:long-chain acyl-CoA synthetase|nr:long-chain fatty acid--CoA ligase [Propionibacteriaceae bacterium]